MAREIFYYPIILRAGEWDDINYKVDRHNLIVFPDIIQFHSTESVGGILNLRSWGPQGENGLREGVRSIPMPTRFLKPQGEGAEKDYYYSQEDLDTPHVREAIDKSLKQIENLLRERPDIYDSVSYFASASGGRTYFGQYAHDGEQSAVGKYIADTIRRIIEEENTMRGF